LKILADANVSPRIPRVIDYGYDKPSHSKALVLDLLGVDLQSIRKQCGGRFSIKTTLMLATRLIPTIRYIHSKDFVHRDIKPGNMLLGPKDSETSVYIIDFGIARRYKNPRNGTHMPFLDGKPLVGTVRYASLNTHFGIAQTRRDDIECLAYSLLDCLRDLPWGHITGGSPKQFEDRVREKKRSWTPERLCVGIPNAFKILLSHARQLKFDEEPDYDGLQKAFINDMKQHGYSPDTPFDWSEASDSKDFAAPFTKQTHSSPAVTENTRKLFDLIRPGDLIKLKLLGPSTIQFSGRFNSIHTDASFWQPPSLASKEWQFPYRPAIVASVERDVVVRKGRKGMTLSVYPLMMRKEGLEEFPEYMRSRYIPLNASTLGIDSRTPQVEPEWTIANTYIYNTCVTLTVSVDPYLMSKAELRPIYWRLKSPPDLMKVTEQLQLVRPPLEAGQSIQSEDRDETIDIKKNKRRILQTVFAEIGPLTLTDAQGQDVVWSGRNGWLKEYNQIGSRRDQEQEGSDDADSSEEYDSDYIYDSISPPGERRKSCTVNLEASNFE
jgi:casein kinase I family protein HRR25